MIGLLTSIHLLIAIILILIVLVQSAKGTDVGSAFGGMGSQAAFGPRGTATFLSKATIGLAAAFMVTSIALSIMASRATVGSDSVLSGEENAPAPAAPAAATPETPAPPPAGTSGVQVDVPGLPGTKATVTVENPDEAPKAITPPGAPQTPAPAPSGQ